MVPTLDACQKNLFFDQCGSGFEGFGASVMFRAFRVQGLQGFLGFIGFTAYGVDRVDRVSCGFIGLRRVS